MLRDKIIFKNAMGEERIGYAILPSKKQPIENTYVWCFDNEKDNCGFIIRTSSIIKVLSYN